MAKQLEVYKCEICGNIVEVLHAGAGTLFCCGQGMTLLQENSVDAAEEKHVPVIVVGQDTVTVTVGSVAHPMQDEHYIQWIELIVDGESHHKFLHPGDAPEAVFNVKGNAFTAREYCNLHGHWKAEA